MNTQMLEHLITYIPIGIFVLFVFIAFIMGLIRGFRKSLILFIHALLAATICIIVFYILVGNPNTDKWAYQISSHWINYNEKLNTTTQYTSMKEVIVDYYITSNNYGDSMRLILAENGAYLDTLVNLAYRIILFIPLIVVFFVLDFIFYLVYFIFYPERRKKAKLRKREQEGNGTGYKKHAGFGGLVGLVRGALVGLVWLSFIGAIFFVVAGGTGEDDKDSYPDYSFTDESLNTAYDTYKIVTTYGNRGIFRVLNTLKDSDKVPYYLFAANMILSGTLNDDTNNIHTTVRFTKEIACYTSFVNKTIKLVLKYDSDGEIAKALESKDSNSLNEYLTTLMEREDFKKDYDALIEEFDSGTYFINFALSFVNSVVAHRNELKGTDELDPQVIKLMDIVFDGEHKIKVSDILTEGDAKNLMKSVVKVLSAQTLIDENTDAARKGMIYAKAFIPQLLELSIFKDDNRKKMFNPLLGDLYKFLAENTVDATQDNTQNLAKAQFDLNEVAETSNIDVDSISWVDELKTLLETSIDVIELADSVYAPGGSMLDIIFSIFPEDNKDLKDKNIEHFDRLINGLSSSKLLDAVLSMTMIKKSLDSGLAAMSESIKLPSKINYVNQYEEDGTTVKEYGEIYVLLTALKELILNNNTKDIVTALQDKAYNQDIIKNISELFTSKLSDGETTLIDLSLKSTVLKYVISGVFLGFEDTADLGFTIVVPRNVCVKDEDDIYTVSDAELKNLFNSLVGTLDIFGDNNQIDFKKVVNNVSNLNSSQIIEASVVNVLVSTLESNDMVSIPQMYKEAGTLEKLKGDYSNNIWHTSGEISNIIYAFDEIFNVSELDTFDLENSLNEISSKFANLTLAANNDSSKMKLDVVYDSAIIRSTIKEFITKQVTDAFIDQELLNSSAVIANIDGVSSIKKEEIKSVIYSINELALDLANIDFSTLASSITSINGPAVTEGYDKKIDVLYSSAILRYAIAKKLDDALADNAELIDSRIVESDYVKTTESFDGKNFKCYSKSEIESLIDSIGIFDISNVENINTEAIKSKLLNITDDKIDTLYGSTIIKCVIAKQLDTAISGVVKEEVRESDLVKEALTINEENFYYYKEEEFAAMLHSLNVLDIANINSFSVNDIKSQVATFNDKKSSESEETKLDVLYSSYVIKYALAERFDQVFSETLNVNEVVLNENKKNDEISTQYYYKKATVVKMIDALGEKGLNYTNLETANDIDENTILSLNEKATGSAKTRLEVICDSDILAYVLSDKLQAAIASNSHLVDDIDAKDEYKVGSSVYLYKTSELSALVKTLNDLGVTNVNNFNASSISLSSSIKDDINSSIIIFDTVSKLVFDNNTLITPVKAITTNSNGTVTKIVNEEQMNYLIDTLLLLNVTDLSSNVSLTLNDSVNQNISKSYILRATVSDKIINNANIYVSTADVDNTDITDVVAIKETELFNTLNAISVGLGINSVSDIASTITLPAKDDLNRDAKLMAISKSQIIRTTITKKIKFSNGSSDYELYVLASDATVLDNRLGGNNNLLSINEEEMFKLMRGIVVAFGDSTGTSTNSTISLDTLKNMQEEDLDLFLESSTIVLVTDIILSQPTLIAGYAIANGSAPASTTGGAYNMNVVPYVSTVKTYLTAAGQKDMVEYAKSLA